MLAFQIFDADGAVAIEAVTRMHRLASAQAQ
jgi:hypothetical protein